jgi:hypothetical protein
MAACLFSMHSAAYALMGSALGLWLSLLCLLMGPGSPLSLFFSLHIGQGVPLHCHGGMVWDGYGAANCQVPGSAWPYFAFPEGQC